MTGDEHLADDAGPTTPHASTDLRMAGGTGGDPGVVGADGALEQQLQIAVQAWADAVPTPPDAWATVADRLDAGYRRRAHPWVAAAAVAVLVVLASVALVRSQDNATEVAAGPGAGAPTIAALLTDGTVALFDDSGRQVKALGRVDLPDGRVMERGSPDTSVAVEPGGQALFVSLRTAPGFCPSDGLPVEPDPLGIDPPPGMRSVPAVRAYRVPLDGSAPTVVVWPGGTTSGEDRTVGQVLVSRSGAVAYVSEDCDGHVVQVVPSGGDAVHLEIPHSGGRCRGCLDTTTLEGIDLLALAPDGDELLATAQTCPAYSYCLGRRPFVTIPVATTAGPEIPATVHPAIDEDQARSVAPRPVHVDWWAGGPVPGWVALDPAADQIRLMELRPDGGIARSVLGPAPTGAGRIVDLVARDDGTLLVVAEHAVLVGPPGQLARFGGDPQTPATTGPTTDEAAVQQRRERRRQLQAELDDIKADYAKALEDEQRDPANADLYKAQKDQAIKQGTAISDQLELLDQHIPTGSLEADLRSLQQQLDRVRANHAAAVERIRSDPADAALYEAQRDQATREGMEISEQIAALERQLVDAGPARTSGATGPGSVPIVAATWLR